MKQLKKANFHYSRRLFFPFFPRIVGTSICNSAIFIFLVFFEDLICTAIGTDMKKKIVWLFTMYSLVNLNKCWLILLLFHNVMRPPSRVFELHSHKNTIMIAPNLSNTIITERSFLFFLFSFRGSCEKPRSRCFVFLFLSFSPQRTPHQIVGWTSSSNCVGSRKGHSCFYCACYLIVRLFCFSFFVSMAPLSFLLHHCCPVSYKSPHFFSSNNIFSV